MSKAGSVPFRIPTENKEFQFCIDEGVCMIASSGHSLESGNLRSVLPAAYPAGIDGNHWVAVRILSEWGWMRP